MKAPRPHVHILTVSEPLLSFYQLEMRCGKILRNALMVYGLNLDFRADMARPSHEKMCPVCRAHAAEPPAANEIRMYQYGLVEKKEWQEYLVSRGEELRDSQDLVEEIA